MNNKLNDLECFFTSDSIDKITLSKFEKIIHDLTMSVTTQTENNNNYINLLDDMVDSAVRFSYLAEKQDLSNNVDRLRSYYLGYIECIIQMQLLLKKQTDYFIKIDKIKKAKYIPEVLDTLYHENVLSYTELYNKLKNTHSDLGKTAFANALVRYENLNIYSKKTEGKNKYYIITSFGRNVYKSIKKPIIQSSSCYTEFTLDLLNSICKEISNETLLTENVLLQLGKYNNNHLISQPKVFTSSIDKIFYTIDKKQKRKISTKSSNTIWNYNLESEFDCEIIDLGKKTCFRKEEDYEKYQQTKARFVTES